MKYGINGKRSRARPAEAEEAVYVLHARVCQTLANPTRLKILTCLRDGEVAVTELARRIGATLPNLSQHLAILKERRVVLARREGATVYYRIANPKILTAFDIMREVLFERLSEEQRLFAEYTSRRRAVRRGATGAGRHGPS